MGPCRTCRRADRRGATPGLSNACRPRPRSPRPRGPIGPSLRRPCPVGPSPSVALAALIIAPLQLAVPGIRTTTGRRSRRGRGLGISGEKLRRPAVDIPRPDQVNTPSHHTAGTATWCVRHGSYPRTADALPASGRRPADAHVDTVAAGKPSSRPPSRALHRRKLACRPEYAAEGRPDLDAGALVACDCCRESIGRPCPQGHGSGARKPHASAARRTTLST